jgi:hypothetical protein
LFIREGVQEKEFEEYKELQEKAPTTFWRPYLSPITITNHETDY